MITVYGCLPFYNSTIKLDVNRSNAIIPIACPRTQLPPFQFALNGDPVSTIDKVELVTKAGAATPITAYFTALPEVYTPISTVYGDYVKYNGDSLTTSLPLGIYYVKLTASGGLGYVYYSDYISVENVYVGSITPNHIYLKFKNTDNFGTLVYEDSWKQEVWLNTILGTPNHETVNVGEEKDGIFIAEKIVTKFTHSIVTYVSRGLYQCLSRLPQHDDITIIDEVGNSYTPAVGNVFINAPEWISFDTAKIIIRFNDNGKTNFTWTT
jgi:hypothetical protein